MKRTGLANNALLSNFGRHTPHILRKQLLCQLLEQYLGLQPIDPELRGDDGNMRECQPSFQRFHGTILFVDISGFTALSLRLNVEELKKHINEYFTMMLDIVDKHGGEVIKFAGDAIYIIWQTALPQKLISFAGDQSTQSMLTSNSFSHDRGGIHHNIQSPQMKLCLEKAVMCGLEISAVCSNHRVVLDPATNPDSNATQSVQGKVLPGWNYLRGHIANGKITPQETVDEKDVTYLNVHSGISNGLMAGIDVGANDRWEFLLTGKPLARVAAAESQAHSGELVLCPFSHEMLHPTRPVHGAGGIGIGGAHGPPPVLKRGMSSNLNNHPTHTAAEAAAISASLLNQQVAADGSQLCSCGCTRTAKGFFRIPPKAVKGGGRVGIDNIKKAKRFAGISTVQDLVLVANENHKVGARIVQQTEKDIEMLFAATKDDFREAIPRIASAKGLDLNAYCDKKGIHSPDELTDSILGNEDLLRHLHRFMQHVLLDDLAAHVHEVARNEFSADPFGRFKIFEHYLTDILEGRAAMPPRTLQAAFDSSAGLSSSLGSSLGAGGLGGRKPMTPKTLATMMSVSHFTSDKSEIDSEVDPEETPAAVAAAAAAASVCEASVISGADSSYVEADSDRAAPLSPKAKTLLGITTDSSSSSSAAVITSAVGAEDTGGAMSPRRATARKSSLSAQGSLATMIRKSSTKRMGNDGVSGVEMSAEIRSVVVMFIKIDSIQMNLWVDASADGFKTVVPSASATNFNFLPKTKKEKRADDVLLSRLQKCMEVVTTALANNGGQLRQFIVDDKGTVAIGTFGLRGSRSEDNAAAALLTARIIVDSLQAVHVASQIGVTAGQAFCGLVGSLQRHEYAVMGPSTNLSARLMGKAASGQIICDIEVKKRDRTHDFEFVSEVVAKGYTNKVPTFCPIFHEQTLTAGDGSLSVVDGSLDNLLGDLSNMVGGGVQVGRVSFSTQMSADSSKGEEGTAVDLRLGDVSLDEGESPSGGREHPLVQLLNRSEFYFRSKEHPANKTGAAGMLADSSKSHQLELESGSHSPTLSPKHGGGGRGSRQQLHSSSKMVLHGRKEEIRQIIVFLFPTLRAAERTVYAGASTKAARASDRMSMRRSGRYSAVFHTNTRARMLCVCAAEGYGKSALVQSIGRKLHVLARQTPNFNIALFRNRPMSFQQNVPFLCWKPIIQEMLYRVPLESMMDKKHVSHGKDEGSVTLSIPRNELLEGLMLLLPLIPEPLRQLCPLLGWAGIIDEETDNEYTANLTNQAKLTMTADLLLALVQQFPVVTKSCIFFVLEELQWMDASSMMLLHKIWLKCNGVVILSSMRPINTLVAAQQQQQQQQYDQHHGGPQSPIPTFRRGNSTLAAVGFSTVEDPLRMFHRSERFLRLDLAHLDRDSTKALIKDSFASHGVQLDDEALEKVYNITGGNLLYAYEVTRSINEQNRGTMTGDQIGDAIAALRCNRIEEVIYHRFDQLNAACQLLLKTASVAGANGSSFTFDLLLHVLGNSDDGIVQHSTPSSLGSEEGLSSALMEILRKDEFLTFAEHTAQRIAPRFNAAAAAAADAEGDGEHDSSAFMEASMDSMLTRDEGAASRMKSNVDLRSCSFEFGIRLEQLTIYGMLLDDQKEYLHEKVASYYFNFSVQPEAEISGPVLCEEGFHWQKACAWAASMSCYLRASEKLRAAGDIYIQRNYLLTAYSMFRSMCDDAGFMHERSLNLHQLEALIADSSSSTNSPFVVGGEHAAAMRQHRPRRFSSIEDDGSFAAERSASLLTIESIYQIFGGDSDDLNYGLKVHIRLAQMNLLLYQDQEFTSKVLDDALQILLLSKNPYILNSKHFMRSLFNHAGGSGSSSEHKDEIHAVAGSPGARAGGLGGVATAEWADGASTIQSGGGGGGGSGTAVGGPGTNASNRKKSTGGKLFCLRNYSAFCFPIVSAYIQLNSWSPRCTAMQMEKALLVCEEALELAAREETDIFTIQLRCQEIMLRINEGNLLDAAASFRLLSKMYISSRHHNKLIALFGMDCVVQTMGNIVPYLVLHGDFDRAVRIADQQMQLIGKIKHNQSLAAAIIPLCCALVQMGCRPKALEFCTKHSLLLSHLANETGVAAVGSFAIFEEWLTRLVKLDSDISHHSDASPLREDSREIDCILKMPDALAVPDSGKDSAGIGRESGGRGSIGPEPSEISWDRDNLGSLSSKSGEDNQLQQRDEWTVPIDDFLLLSGLTSNLLCAEMCLLKIQKMLLRLPPHDEEQILAQNREIDLYEASMEKFLQQSDSKVSQCAVTPLIYSFNLAFFKLRKHHIVSTIHARNGAAVADTREEDARLEKMLANETEAGANGVDHGDVGTAAVAAAASAVAGVGSPRSAQVGMIGTVDPTSHNYSIHAASNPYRAQDIASTERVWKLLQQTAALARDKKFVFALMVVGAGMQLLERSPPAATVADKGVDGAGVEGGGEAAGALQKESEEEGLQLQLKADELLKQLLSEQYDRYMPKILRIVEYMSQG